MLAPSAPGRTKEEGKIGGAMLPIRFKNGHAFPLKTVAPASKEEVYSNYPVLFNYYLSREKPELVNGTSGHDSNSI